MSEFKGKWTDAEKIVVLAVLRESDWNLVKRPRDEAYLAHRENWGRETIGADSATGLAWKIRRYYETGKK